jgi:hypothetical protein
MPTIRGLLTRRGSQVSLSVIFYFPDVANVLYIRCAHNVAVGESQVAALVGAAGGLALY